MTSLYDVSPEVVAFMYDLATMPHRDQELYSNLGTKGDAYNMRLKVYRWRRKLMEALGQGPTSMDARLARELMQNLLGPRATPEWLQLTEFKCRLGAPPDRWMLVGLIRRPMYGPDIEWTTGHQELPPSVPVPDVQPPDFERLLARAKELRGRSPNLA